MLSPGCYEPCEPIVGPTLRRSIAWFGKIIGSKIKNNHALDKINKPLYDIANLILLTFVDKRQIDMMNAFSAEIK